MKILVAFVIAGALLSTPNAHACSPPACRASWASPVAGKSVPANAPAVVFVQGTAKAGPPIMPGPPSLKNGAGPIASTRDGDFLRPAAALPLGDVVLEWDETCNPPWADGGIAPTSLTFTVVAASALPTALGTATLAYARGNVDVWTSSGSCTDKLDASQARFSFDLDPALVKFREVARFVTSVDGTKWGSSAWGREGPTATPGVFSGDGGAHRHDLVFAACGPSPTGVTDRGVMPGKHTVEIRAEVAGAPAIPSAKFEINLACDGASPDGGSVTPDAAAPTLDAAPDAATDAMSDGTPAAADADPPAMSSDGGGCSAAGGTVSPFCLLIAVAMLGRARRRRASR